MLSPKQKKNATPKKKTGEKKSRSSVRDLSPLRGAKGGGIPKTSSVSLCIPPKGFIADEPQTE